MNAARTRQQEASARAFALKQSAEADPAADREANAHLEPEQVAAEPAPYPRDSRGFTDTRGAADYLAGIFSEPSLRKARHTGRGPAFLKIGGAVRYSFAALDAWLASRARTSTRDDAAA